MGNEHGVLGLRNGTVWDGCIDDEPVALGISCPLSFLFSFLFLLFPLPFRGQMGYWVGIWSGIFPMMTGWLGWIGLRVRYIVDGRKALGMTLCMRS